jgi:hypothetical protein
LGRSGDTETGSPDSITTAAPKPPPFTTTGNSLFARLTPQASKSKPSFMISFGRLRAALFAGLALPILTWGQEAPKTPPRVLMIGDSLSVGPFGELVERYLEARLGRSNFALFATCGSSPEHWLRSQPDFYTRCGYREDSPERRALIDFEDGKPLPRIKTPKVEDLIAKYHPTTLIVQLGTNWMDSLTKPQGHEEDRFSNILDHFAAALRGPRSSVRQVIWIMPPDASAYSPAVKRTVDSLIKNVAKKNTYWLIDSRLMTHYIRGKTGGDGVHYSKGAAQSWADQVARNLDGYLGSV